MLSTKQLADILGDKTRVKILRLLSEKEMTTTEIFKEMPEIKYRESVFKALKKLAHTGLIKRRFYKKTMAYKYASNFKTIKIDNKMQLKIE